MKLMASVVGVLATVSVAGCVGSSSKTTTTPEGEEHYVKDIRLSEWIGEVGKPFSGEISYNDNYIDEPEFSVSGLPPGLAWDEKTRTIKGTPKRAGFYTVNFAVRQKPPDKAFRRADMDDRWWPQELKVEIYPPVGK